MQSHTHTHTHTHARAHTHTHTHTCMPAHECNSSMERKKFKKKSQFKAKTFHEVPSSKQTKYWHQTHCRWWSSILLTTWISSGHYYLDEVTWQLFKGSKCPVNTCMRSLQHTSASSSVQHQSNILISQYARKFVFMSQTVPIKSTSSAWAQTQHGENPTTGQKGYTPKSNNRKSYQYSTKSLSQLIRQPTFHDTELVTEF